MKSFIKTLIHSLFRYYIVSARRVGEWSILKLANTFALLTDLWKRFPLSLKFCVIFVVKASTYSSYFTKKIIKDVFCFRAYFTIIHYLKHVNVSFVSLFHDCKTTSFKINKILTGLPMVWTKLTLDYHNGCDLYFELEVEREWFIFRFQTEPSFFTDNGYLVSILNE